MKVLMLLIAFAALAAAGPQEDGYVLTPFGYWPAECVHEAPSNSRIVPTGPALIVEKPDGTFNKYGRCARMNMTEFAHQRRAKRMFTPNQDYPNGWAAYAEEQLTSNCAVFNGQWPVPDVPAVDQNQTVFLFTGLQNAFFLSEVAAPLQDVTIIQPVLQWGPSSAGGGNYWAIASWYVGSGGELQYSTLAQVNPGDLIVGNMSYSGGSWTIDCVDQTSGVTSNLQLQYNQPELYAFVTLEVYSIDSCSDYPNGETTFSSLAINDQNGPVTPAWTEYAYPGCNEAVDIVGPTEVTIQF